MAAPPEPFNERPGHPMNTSFPSPAIATMSRQGDMGEPLEEDTKLPSSSKKQHEIEDDLESQASVYANSFTRKLLQYGVEANGVRPISAAERNDQQYFKVFTLWVSMSVGVIP